MVYRRTLWTEMHERPEAKQAPAPTSHREAVCIWYDAHVHDLFLYGCSLTQDESKVKDAIQEVFCSLLTRKGTLDDVRDPKRFLFGAMRNLLRKEMRREETHRRLSQLFIRRQPAAESPAPLLRFEQGENPALLAAIHTLPPRLREVLFLRYYEGLDIEATARLASLSHQAVRNYTCRALKRLRKHLAKHKPK